jgi:hypothetical protein
MLCLSQASTWMSNVIYSGRFLCSTSSVGMRGDCPIYYKWEVYSVPLN